MGEFVICTELAPNAVATCDPYTGEVGTCLPAHGEQFNGMPCELFSGASWKQLDLDGWLPPGLSCLPADAAMSLGDVFPQRIEVVGGTKRCGSGAVLPVAEPCPPDVEFTPHGDPPASPDENGCTPLTCDAARLLCGIALDGCGHYVDCGECAGRIQIPLPASRVDAAAASAERQLVYVAKQHPSGAYGIVAISPEAPTVQSDLIELPTTARDLVVNDEANVMFVALESGSDEAWGLGVVDLEAWTLRFIELGTPPGMPDAGPDSLEVASVSLVPGRSDLVAVYLGRSTGAEMFGLALYDVATGVAVHMPEVATDVPAVRSVFPGEEGAIYAGLDEPLLLRRYEIVGDRVVGWRDYSPNQREDLADRRWVWPIWIGGVIIDAAGVVVDAGSGEQVSFLGDTGAGTRSFAADPHGDRFYGYISDVLTAFDAASLRPVAAVDDVGGEARVLWLGEHRLVRYYSGSWNDPIPDIVSWVRSDVVGP